MAKPLLCPFQPTNKKEKLKTFYTKSIFYSHANVKRRKLRRGKTKEIVSMHAKQKQTTKHSHNGVLDAKKKCITITLKTEIKSPKFPRIFQSIYKQNDYN